MSIFQQVSSFFKNIFNIIKKPFVWLWNLKALGWLRNILTWIWRILVPLLLLGLLIVPIFLTYFPKAATVVSLNTPKVVAKGDVTKKISVQATVQNSLAYELPSFQDAVVKEILVNQGDKVVEGQVLAKLDFVSETKVRATTVENQIRGYQNDIANNNQALSDLQSVTGANYNQMAVAKSNRTTELNELNQKKADKIKELADKKIKYQAEKDDFDRQIKELENFKDATDAIKQYQDKIDADRLQLAGYENSNLNAQLQTQQNTANTQINTAQMALTNAQNVKTTACNANPLIQSACDSAITQLNTAQDAYNTTNNTNSNLNNQINNNNNVNNINRNFLINRINENQNRINSLGNSRLYEPNKATDLPITETAKTARLQQVLSDLRADSNSRKTSLKAIDDNVELVPINEQILAKQKTIDELATTQNVSNKTMNQTASNIEQRNATAQVSLNNANIALQDTIEDIQKQEKNHTIIAKKDGIVGKINVKQGLQANARDSVFSMISPEYQLVFSVSADNRAQLKNGLSIITDKFPNLTNFKITDTSNVPDPVITGTATTGASTTTTTYTVKADLPKSLEYTYIPGSTVNIDVVIDSRSNVLSVPTTAVSGGVVYVGTGYQRGSGGNGGQGAGGGGNGNFQRSTATSNSLSNSNSSISSQGGVNKLQNAKFTEIKQVEVETGLDDGKNTEIKSGLNEGDYIFTIFPKTDADTKTLLSTYLSN